MSVSANVRVSVRVSVRVGVGVSVSVSVSVSFRVRNLLLIDGFRDRVGSSTVARPRSHRNRGKRWH